MNAMMMLMNQLQMQLKAKNPQVFQQLQNLQKNQNDPQELISKMINNYSPEQMEAFMKYANGFGISNEQLNKLELKFLELIQYNTHIKFSTYTKYYLELKAVEPDFPLKPMDVFTKAKLEHQSKNMEEKLKKNAKTSKDAKEAGQNTVYVIN